MRLSHGWKALTVMGVVAASVSLAPASYSAWSAWEFNYGGVTAGKQLGDCNDANEIVVDYGKGCFRETGDWFITRDTKFDGKDVGIKWENSTSARRGVCRGNGGAQLVSGHDVSCNKDLLEQTVVAYWLVRNDPSNNPEVITNWVDQTTPLYRLNDHG